MRRMLRSLCLVPLWLVLGAQSEAAAQRVDPGAPEITGTLVFYGCAPAPEDFTIVGVPLRADAPDGVRDGEPAEPVIVTGALSRTADPRTFSLSLPAVQSDVAHQLRIRPAHGRANPCGRVFWEGPEQGIAFPGVPVHLVGYAPHSSIEVRAAAREGRARSAWVGADSIAVHDPRDAVRQFRWLTRTSGVTGGLIQVSTVRFPKDTVAGRGCGVATGVIHERTFPARPGTWNSVPPLNLAAIASSVARSGPNGPAQFELFAFGAPLYVRVLPIVNGSVRCEPRDDGPAPWVVLSNLPKDLQPSDGGEAGPPPQAPILLTAQSNHVRPWVSEYPKGSQTMYRTTKPHLIAHDIFSNFPQGFVADPFGFMVAKYIPALAGPGDVLPAGSLFLLWPGSGGFDIGDVFEGAVSIVTGVIDAVGLLVNEISKAYDSIKKAVGDVIVSAISATGLVDCESSPLCQQLVATAISTGLMAAGLPPSLPNWNAVVDQGYEYLAAEIVSQAGASAVPGAQELTKAAVQALVEKTIQEMSEKRGGGGGLPDWLSIDVGQEPPVLIVELWTVGSTSGALFPDRLPISGNAATVGALVKIPSAWTGFLSIKSLKIPIVLRPNLIGFTPPVGPFGTPLSEYLTALAAKTWWGNRLQSTPCVTVNLALLKKMGSFVLLPTPFTLPVLRYNPQTSVWFNPIYQHCTQ